MENTVHILYYTTCENAWARVTQLEEAIAGKKQKWSQKEKVKKTKSKSDWARGSESWQNKKIIKKLKELWSLLFILLLGQKNQKKGLV